ncbi:DUF5667 domain-containing protein [Rossellomorea vietnamensis]|uniref:DUF5667 domain-containing protein n=1 Tax=Rossellomorea vietnamensis TaxID=218284 RepID=A0A0P6WTW1_9BACI|nr:DUF5667 domain-containing protein [Rossellomorea vietnamensis]KPL61350.1 hypothetical protein AM506_01590 [Rossellomorea vietnamensis]
MKKQSKIMKSSLAVIVASSISLPGSLAFANSNGDNFDSIKLDQEKTASADVAVNDDAMLESSTNEIEKLQESTEAPSLLPGDFFYFAKLAIEKIQLAFTMDEAKEAKLLAGYAAERLAEVEELFKDGKQEEAIEALNKAIEMMKKSENQWSDDEIKKDSADGDSVESDTEKKDESKVEEETDNTTSGDAVNEESTSGDRESEENSGDIAMEEMMAQNILSLKANMEKVKNPKAKAALLKNIEKSYLKLAEKLDRLDKKAEKKAKKDETEENTKTPMEESPLIKTEEPAKEEAPVEQTTEMTNPEKEETVSPVKEPVEKKEEKKEVKKEWKAQHKEAKQVRKQEKVEAKEVRKQEKKEAHYEKKEEKQQHPAPVKVNHRHSENDKRQEGGKGHHKES